MYYGGGMSSEGHAAGEGEYGYASAYDEGAYEGADPYTQQQYYAQQQPQVPYGQPGEIMQYPGQTTYPPQQQQQQPQQLYPASPTNSGGIPYQQHHQSMGSDGASAPSEPQEHLRGPSPPAALVPGAVGSPAPSHRSIPQLGAMQFEQQSQPPMPMPGSGSSDYGGQQQPLRVVNDGGEDPYGGMDDAGGNAYHYQQQQPQYYGQH